MVVVRCPVDKQIIQGEGREQSVNSLAGVQLPPRLPDLTPQIPRLSSADRDRIRDPPEVAGSIRSLNVNHANVPTAETPDNHMQSQAGLRSIQRDNLANQVF